MGLFEVTFDSVRGFIEGKGGRRGFYADPSLRWPSGGRRNVVLGEEVGVELGNPKTESVSSLVWTGKRDLVRDGAITLIGPDISESRGMSVPFGKVVLVGVHGFTGDNAYERYREMERIRYGLDLEGYMLKSAPQYQREWSRISKSALDKGFGFEVLGASLVRGFKAKAYVDAVEILFVTSSQEDVQALRGITENASQIIGAMNKMAEEIECDCNDCEYQEVCDEVDELRSMKASLQKRGGKKDE